jgi:DNA-binding MarR family transcriptional regulator
MVTTATSEVRSSVDDTLGFLLRAVQQRQSRVLDVGNAYGVSGPQLSVLGAVAADPGIDQRGVTRATFIDKSTVASLVSKLTARGLLVSSRAAADGRRDQLHATAEAVEIVYVTSPLLTTGNDAIIAALPPGERERFLRLLREVGYADRHESPDIYVMPSPDGIRPPIEVRWGLGRPLRGCAQRYARLWNEKFGPLLTPVQYLALNAVKHADRIDQRSLGDSILLDKASLTEMLERLQRRGLVAKLGDPADRRRRLLTLSSPGRVLLAGVGPEAANVDSEFLSPLPPGQRRFFTGALRSLFIAGREQPSPGA